ncbi:hypothetical protein KFU94_32955 [Chloroflexi bacterium TSY]|nr:hypothetical protein [Chloroflexi bacterium TSY]
MKDKSMNTSNLNNDTVASQTACIRWAAWFGDRELKLALPDGWLAGRSFPSRRW